MEKMLTGTLHKLFYIPVYSCPVESYGVIDSLVTDELIDKVVVPRPNGWNCEVDTSFSQKAKDITWVKSFLNIVRPKIFEYFKASHSTDKVELVMDLPWINRYTRGQYQERHNHLASDAFTFSYCYFHRLPAEEGCAQFMFRSNNSDQEHLTPKLVCSQLSFKPEVKQHDIIIFPSWVDHLVTTHNLDNPRVTISGNFSVNIKAH